LYVNGSNDLSFQYQGSDKVTFQSGGNVGIGTTSPVSKLNINNGDAWINVTDTLRGLQFGYAGPSHGSYRAAVMGGAESHGGTDSGMLTFHTQNGYVVSAVPPERMRITSAGNVGIGDTDTYGVRMHIAGVGAATSTGTGSSNIVMLLRDTTAGAQNVGAGIAFAGNDGANTGVTFATINGRKETGTSGDYASYLSFQTRLNGNNLTERMRITSDGNVGIGTTEPSAELQVNKASDVVIAMSNSTSITSGNRGNLAFYNSDISTVALIRASAVTDNVGTQLEFYTRPAAGSLTQVLTLASTGAATFSSSVTATTFLGDLNGTINTLTTGTTQTAGNNSTLIATTAYADAAAGAVPIGNYLPLAGGTLTGALGGTSATFSGGARFFSALNYMEFLQNVLTSQNNDGAHIRSVVSADATPTYSFAGDQDTGMFTSGANILGFSTAGVQRLSIASTGAATFSSSVTAVGLSSTTSAPGNLNSLIRNTVTSASATTGYGLAIESEASAATSYALTVRNLAASTTYFHISTATGSVGNVGIGTTSPARALQVNGTARATRLNSTGGVVDFDAETGNNFIQIASNIVSIANGGNVSMTITATGNVGIGTTSPGSYDTAKIGGGHKFLNVEAGSSSYAVATLAGNQAASGDRLGYLTFVNNTNSATYKYSSWIGSEAEGSTANQLGGRLIFSTTGDGSTAGPIERMRITSDGSLLVGATNADIGGSVKGAIIRQDGSIVAARNIASPFHYQTPISADRMNTMGDGIMYSMWREGVFQAGIGATNTSNMTFFTGDNASASEHMRITSGGTVGIGATSGITTSTYAGKLAISAASGANVVLSTGTNTDNAIVSRIISVNSNNANSGNEGAAEFYGVTSIESAITTTDSNAGQDSGGYIMLKTKPEAGALAERMRIASNGVVRLNAYGSGGITGSPTYNLAVDASGNIIELPGGVVDGSGTANYVSKWSDANTLTDSVIYDDGTNVGIGTASPTQKLEVDGVIESPYLEFKPVVFYDFNSDTTGDWSKGNSTLSVPNDSVTRYTSTGADSNISKAFNFDGGQNQIIRIRYKVVTGPSGGGEIFYANSQHGYDASYFKSFTLVSDGAWHTLVLDMSSLNAGGTDWIDYNVTLIRFDLTNVSGVAIDIDWISIGGNGYGTQYFENDVAFMNGNVGIGTTAPAQKLHVDGAIRLTSNPSVTGDGSSAQFWDEAGVGPTIAGANFQVRTNGNTTALHINSSQNVGIGTTNPGAKLDVYRGLQTDTITRANAAAYIWGADVGLAIGQYSSGPYGTWLQSLKYDNNNSFPLSLNPSGGNVGIGTAEPDAIFHVAKAVSSGVGGQIVIDNPASSAVGNTAELSFLTDAGASGAGTRNAKILAVNTNAGNGAAELQFHTWNGAAELKRMNIAYNGVITFGAYGSGNVTGTPTYNLAVDARVTSLNSQAE
jgi:hypothetical protein